jgi:hypothetical protein
MTLLDFAVVMGGTGAFVALAALLFYAAHRAASEAERTDERFR